MDYSPWNEADPSLFLPLDLPDPGELVLEADGIEYIRATPNGGFYVLGRCIDVDDAVDRRRVYEALRDFLSRT